MFLVAAILVVGTASALAAAHEFFSVDLWTAHGKISRTVDGVRFSFTVPSHEQPYYKPDFGWMNGPAEKVGDSFRVRNLLMGTSILAGQAAEAVVFWTAFPDGGEAAPCPSLLGPAMVHQPPIWPPQWRGARYEAHPAPDTGYGRRTTCDAPGAEGSQGSRLRPGVLLYLAAQQAVRDVG